jgi:NDP-sugar pyrophosphorylase family protein
MPKSLIPINGRPFAEYQLAWLAGQAITDIVICIGYLGEQIREAIGSGSAFGVNVRYADEGQDLKGTGGALRVALDAGLLADTFYVLYGDSFLPIPFAPVLAHFRSSNCEALMTVMRNDNRWDNSNIIYSAPKVVLYDKKPDAPTRKRMNYIDYGLLVLARDLVARTIPSGARTDLADVLKPLSLSGSLAGFEIGERFYEIGSQAGIEEFSRYASEASL